MTCTQIPPAQQGAPEAAGTELPCQQRLIVRAAAKQRGKGLGDAGGLFLVHGETKLAQNLPHLGDADRFEDVVIHRCADGAFCVFKIRKAGNDDDVDVLLQFPCLKGQGNAIHAWHTDVGDEQIDLFCCKKGQGRFAADAGLGDSKAGRIFLHDGSHIAQRGHFVIHDENLIHRIPPVQWAWSR